MFEGRMYLWIKETKNIVKEEKLIQTWGDKYSHRHEESHTTCKNSRARVVFLGHNSLDIKTSVADKYRTCAFYLTH